MEIAIERNDHEAASEWAGIAAREIDEMESIGTPWVPQNTVMCRLAKYFLTWQDARTGKYYLQKTYQDIGEMLENSPHLFPEPIAVQTQLWIAEKDYEQAERWLKKRLDFLNETEKPAITEPIELARVYIALGRPGLSIPILTQLEPSARIKGMGKRLIELYTLLSRAYWLEGQKEKAFQSIRQAIHLSRPEGYVRVFINEGPEMEKLLGECLAETRNKQIASDQASEADYIDRLTGAFDQDIRLREDAVRDVLIKAPELSANREPLSEREMEVLTMLEEGKSVKEVAIALTITANTTKAHLRNSYRKLDVHTRKGAIQRAKELGMSDKY